VDVVLYRFSTSNHNTSAQIRTLDQLYYIVSLHQTTTSYDKQQVQRMLYYIVSLHQTTTRTAASVRRLKLYYIVSLHQTTTVVVERSAVNGCIISFLYIKPQLTHSLHFQNGVVLYRFSTSNHNKFKFEDNLAELYYIVSLHQTTTGCIFVKKTWLLYYIVSLHQTTTLSPYIGVRTGLYYIVSLHQTTTFGVILNPFTSCIISFLYVKPQPNSGDSWEVPIVLYRFSTSNHNIHASMPLSLKLYYIVSLHQTTTNSYMWR